jgi:hypothetical protein
LIISPILGGVAKKIVQLLKVDELSEKMGVKETFDNMGLTFTFSALVGSLVKWFFLLAFLIAAVDILNWTQVTQFLYQIALYIPNVIIAVILVAIGLIAGEFLKDAVTKGLKASSTPVAKPELLGRMAKWAVTVFAILAAVLQLKIAEELVVIAFAGLVFALSLAFGLGGKEKAAQFLQSVDASQRK